MDIERPTLSGQLTYGDDISTDELKVGDYFDRPRRLSREDAPISGKIKKINPKTVVLETIYGAWGDSAGIPMDITIRKDSMNQPGNYVGRGKKVHVINPDVVKASVGSIKSTRKPLKDMSKAELKQLRVILHILPDGTLEIKEKGTDSLERQVASWNPPNRPDMTVHSIVGGHISGERIADNAKAWLDAVAKRYDLDMGEIVSDSWRGGGMKHKSSPYDYTTNTFTGKVKTVSGSATVIDKSTDLQSIHDSRSPRSKESDERQSNADTIEPDDSRVEQWVKDQGRLDIVNIDTPKKHKGKKVARKTRKSTRTETQVRGVRQ